jgi:methionine-rich copper-binding protein CopC
MTLNLRAGIFALAAIPGLMLAGGSPALAHAMLVTAVPADQASASPAPKELRLTFSEGIELAFSTVDVTGPDDAVVEEGTLSLDPANGKALVVPLAAPLASGAYEVSWSVVASDGHKSSGTYTFTVRP